MNDITEQRTMTETFAPQADSELHRIPVLKDEEELIEMSTDFNLEEFQVVRREFFAHIREPAVTFNNRKFYVNSACLTKFPHTDYVQALINPHTKILALRPCGENERGSFQWCSIGQGKRKPRQTTCTLFFLKMFDMMDWNPDHRYKMLGNIIRANGEYLIAFDLTSTEVYQRTYDAEGAKSTVSRTPVYPIGWQNQFGMTLNEHKLAIQGTDKRTNYTHRVNLAALHPDNFYEIYSTSFINKLCSLVEGLDSAYAYRLTGEIIAEENAGVFPLSSLQKIDGLEER